MIQEPLWAEVYGGTNLLALRLTLELKPAVQISLIYYRSYLGVKDPIYLLTAPSL